MKHVQLRVKFEFWGYNSCFWLGVTPYKIANSTKEIVYFSFTGKNIKSCMCLVDSIHLFFVSSSFERNFVLLKAIHNPLFFFLYNRKCTIFLVFNLFTIDFFAHIFKTFELTRIVFNYNLRHYLSAMHTKLCKNHFHTFKISISIFLRWRNVLFVRNEIDRWKILNA